MARGTFGMKLNGEVTDNRFHTLQEGVDFTLHLRRVDPSCEVVVINVVSSRQVFPPVVGETRPEDLF